MNLADLPADLDRLADVLVAAVGSGHPLNIDGIGGGSAVTTKVAMLSRSGDGWADIDYFFAQVSVEDGLVDYKPTCGNIMSGVFIIGIVLSLVGLLVPIPFMALELLTGLIQAYIFTVLAMVFIGGAVGHTPSSSRSPR